VPPHDEQRAKVLGLNAAKFFKIEVPEKYVCAAAA
jgi:hypothetical protein